MIQPAALPIFVPGSAMSETPADNPGATPHNSADSAQFAGILAMQSDGTAPAVLPITPAEPASVPATTLPQTGNMLPSALPQLQVKQTFRAGRVLGERAVISAKASATHGKPDSTPASETLPESQPLGVLVVAGQMLQTEMKAHPEGPVSGEKRAAGSAPLGAQTAPLISKADMPPQTTILTPAPMPEQAAERAKAGATATALTLTDAPKPMAGAASHLRVGAGLESAANKHTAPPPLAASEQVTPSAPQLAASPIASDQPVTTPATAAAEPRHDFSQLVDRLVAAREAAMPNPVHASLNHAEFGQVQLTFAHDAAGLTVAMASNDPDFARAVTAAAPAERQSGAGGDGQGNSSASSDNRTPGQTQTGPQENGSDGRSGRPFARQTAAAAKSSSEPATLARGRPGIFA